MAQPQAPHILIVPYPAQGHMIPLLDLAHHLSQHNLTITIAITPSNLPLLSPLLSSSTSIHPLVLPFPFHPSIPSGVENAKDLPKSSFLLLLHAISGLHRPLLNWAHSTPNPPSLILSDFFLGWTYHLAAELSIPRLVFFPSGAGAIALIHCLWREMPARENPDDPNFPVSFPSLPNSPTYPWYQLSRIYRSYKKGDPVSEFIRDGFLSNIKSWGVVFNSFEELEGKYLDHVRRDMGHARVWAVGPISPIESGRAGRGGASSVPAGDLMTWLDGCGEGSVVYVCFGSQVVLSPSQAAAIAAGLETSGARFVWCVKGGVVVPEGFEERMEGRGLVVKGWAPQVAVLGHKSVGSFLTHCGWNSVMEGIAAGVAMLMWPMGADQYLNARLVVEELGAGVRVCEGADAVPDPAELARVVGESVGGDGRVRVRVRAGEIRRKAVEAVREGGSSWNELRELVEVIKGLKRKEGTD